MATFEGLLGAIRRRRDSLVTRYGLLAVVLTLVPLLSVGLLYDRYASGLLDLLAGERLEHRLATMAGRLRAFLEARAWQLETLAAHPAAASLFDTDGGGSADFEAVLAFEADHPDLYGILLFAADGRLERVVPGQAASGPPYRDGTADFDGLPRSRFGDADLLGPLPPMPGRPGALLLRRPLADGGSMALHIRLASLTERLGGEDVAGYVRPLLLAPDGRAWTTTGRPQPPPADPVRGEILAPGWQVALAVDRTALAAPLRHMREALVLLVLLLGLGLPLAFCLAFARSHRRLATLVAGVGRIADGDLACRLPEEGRDEIAILARAANLLAARLGRMIRATVETEKMALLGRFAAGVAHEIRNPLASLRAGVQALLLDEPAGDRRQILEAIGEELDRLDSTLDDFLAWARPRPPSFVPTDPGELLRRVAVLAARRAAEHGIRIRTETAVGCSVEADPVQLQQVLINLVINAIEAMPAGGELLLRAGRHAGGVRIEVSDTGHGIPPELLPRVGEPFVTTRPNGTGLGLAISRQLVESNRGRLDIDSRPGAGTRVFLDFPEPGTCPRPPCPGSSSSTTSGPSSVP